VCLTPVGGHDIDYTQTAEEVIEDSLDKLMQVNPDLIVGSSMGGWLVGILGAKTGIPFVAINPVCSATIRMTGVMQHPGSLSMAAKKKGLLRKEYMRSRCHWYWWSFLPFYLRIRTNELPRI